MASSLLVDDHTSLKVYRTNGVARAVEVTPFQPYTTWWWLLLACHYNYAMAMKRDQLSNSFLLHVYRKLPGSRCYYNPVSPFAHQQLAHNLYFMNLFL